MEHWGKKIYWVVQEPVYKYFEGRYNLQRLAFHEDHSTLFSLYDLKVTGQNLELVASRKISASMDQLFGAFRNNPNIPSVEKFQKTLAKKIHTGAQISLRLGRSTKSPSIDIKPPTETGKVREEPAEYLKTDLVDEEE
jgi:hypothetical protein